MDLKVDTTLPSTGCSRNVVSTVDEFRGECICSSRLTLFVSHAAVSAPNLAWGGWGGGRPRDT